MRFGFVTCVRLGLSCMEEIYRINGKLELAITLRDDLAQNKSGRIYLDEFCYRHKIPLIKIKNINDEESISALQNANLDWLFIVGWSQIAGPTVLKTPRYGCLGMHPTLLPTGRGRAPIPWAILKRLDKTGVTLFKLDEKVDAGPIIAQEIIIIEPRETASTLYEKVEKAHRKLISKIWPELEVNQVKFIPQSEEEATYWPARKPEDGKLFPFFTTKDVDLLVRAVTRPYPGAYIEKDGKRYIFWAGIPHENVFITEDYIDDKRHYLFRTSDGCFEVTDWEVK